MSENRVRNIVIVGGGAAGWLAASALARLLKPDFCNVRLIENAAPLAGANSQVALPSFHRLNALLGINENDLMQRTRATFRLGARFVAWSCIAGSYFHTSGSLGARLGTVPFHHCWLKLRHAGFNTSLADYSVATAAALRGRFARPDVDPRSVLSLYSYGFHFHADALAAYLREYAVAHGVTRVGRNIVEVQLRGEDGFIKSLQLEDGLSVEADLYIDCSIDGVLSRAVMGDRHVDWSHWIPCDRAVAVSCAAPDESAPYSKALAGKDGWQWQIPLQHSVDTGYAYSSSFVSDDEAATTLLAQLPGSALEGPRLLQLTTSRPARFWDKNCLVLAGGALEQLESTGLHLVQTGIMRLLTLFPVCRFSSCDIEEYNRLTVIEYERIRDFLILHYKATTRTDSPYWDYCRTMDIPDTLRARIELFQCCARVSMLDDEHFGEDSWLSVLLGQHIEPRDYDPLADVLDIDDVRSALDRMQSMIRQGVDSLPMHGRFIDAHCRARAAQTPT